MDDPAQSEADLRHWLANEDWYMSRHTRRWLDTTPADVAADTLARIAEAAVPEPRSLWGVFLTAVATSGFSPSGAIAGQGPADRKAGVRAALMLADLNDVRCVPPLVRVFETNPAWQNKYQELIEAALLRFLPRAADLPEARQYAPDIHDLARRLWNPGDVRRDLPARSADLLLAAIRFLHGSGREPDHSLLESIAESTATGSNRLRVREVARAIIGVPNAS